MSDALVIGADASYSGGVAYWAGMQVGGAGWLSAPGRMVRGEAPAESGTDAEAVACIRAVGALAGGAGPGTRVLVHNDNEWVVRHVLNGVPLPHEAKPHAREVFQRRRAELLEASRGAQVVGKLTRRHWAWYRQLDSAAYDRMLRSQPEGRP